MDQYSELQEAANILREGIEDIADLVDMASRQTVQVEALLKQQASVISSIGSSIQAARVVPVSRLVPGLRRIVRTVSSDLNKSVKVKVLNEVGSLERDDYARCQTILEHMVRNALDHGLESSEERLHKGKPASGVIQIRAARARNRVEITLSDDGRVTVALRDCELPEPGSFLTKTLLDVPIVAVRGSDGQHIGMLQ